MEAYVTRRQMRVFVINKNPAASQQIRHIIIADEILLTTIQVGHRNLTEMPASKIVDDWFCTFEVCSNQQIFYEYIQAAGGARY